MKTAVLILTTLFAVAGSLLGAASVAHSTDVSTALDGRYSRHFLNGDMDGNRYWSDDVVEVVAVSADAAYIRVVLEYANGHSCTISGVGRVTGNNIVYVGPESLNGSASDRKLCTLTVSRRGRDLLIDDGDGSCWGYCGARGTLTNVTLPFTSKRPISYMPRLKASKEYTTALAAWQADQGQ